MASVGIPCTAWAPNAMTGLTQRGGFPRPSGMREGTATTFLHSFLERGEGFLAEASFWRGIISQPGKPISKPVLSDSNLTHDESEGKLTHTELATWPAGGAWAAAAPLTSVH